MIPAMSKRAIFSRAFWVDAAERAIKTFAQGVLVSVGQDVVGADLFSATIVTAGGAGLALAVVSVLTSVASAPVAGLSPASIAPAGA